MVLKLRFNDFLEARQLLEGKARAGARKQGFKVALFAHQRMAKLQRECAAMMLEHLDAAIYSTCKALRGVV